ncbi:MAG: 2-oxo acid dehydrogenase subunit E2 [Planctomycetota bacterium]
MKWPLKSRPLPQAETPFFNLLYLSAHRASDPDSTIVWTSELDWEPLRDYLENHKQDNARLIGSSHILVQAVGQALAQHPEINRRVVGRRVYEFKQCNVCLAARVPRSHEVNVVQIHDADRMTADKIAYICWQSQIAFMRNASPECRDRDRFRKLPMFLFKSIFRTMDFLDRWFVLPVWGRVDRLRESAVLVNDFSNLVFPVMRGYKPSRQPGDSKPLSVTLGRPEPKVVWGETGPIQKTIAPITVRVDHRICDGFQLGQFINTVVRLMQNPADLEETAMNHFEKNESELNNIQKQAA